MKKTILVLCISSLFGCAQLQALTQKPTQTSSYVAQEISDEDSEFVGENMAGFIASQLPAAKTNLYIEPSKAYLRDVLIGELTGKGFGILPVKSDTGSTLQYIVTPLQGGILVRMKIQDKAASRYYRRSTDGELIANKITVREEAK